MHSNELPPLGRLRPGDPVIMFVKNSARKPYQRYPATVDKIGTKYIYLTENATDQSWAPQTWQCLITTQTVISSYGDRDYFRTPEQAAWDDELRTANAVLKDAGIDITSGSSWNQPMERVRLADFIAPNRHHNEEKQ